MANKKLNRVFIVNHTYTGICGGLAKSGTFTRAIAVMTFEQLCEFCVKVGKDPGRVIERDSHYNDPELSVCEVPFSATGGLDELPSNFVDRLVRDVSSYKNTIF